MYQKFFKRPIDLCISLCALIILGPLLLIIAIWLHFANKGAGVFFYQDRPGMNEKIFKVVKFKTMTDERDEDGMPLPDDQRLTKIGRFIRNTSIDELPQLINVLKGDMSIVGPRPLLTQYLPLYSERQARRHEVKPGITGWAQVNGRNLMMLSKKFEYDVWYVENTSLILDTKILILSIFKIITRNNVGNGALDMQEVDDLNFINRLKSNNKEL